MDHVAVEYTLTSDGLSVANDVLQRKMRIPQIIILVINKEKSLKMNLA